MKISTPYQQLYNQTLINDDDNDDGDDDDDDGAPAAPSGEETAAGSALCLAPRGTPARRARGGPAAAAMTRPRRGDGTPGGSYISLALALSLSLLFLSDHHHRSNGQ